MAIPSEETSLQQRGPQHACHLSPKREQKSVSSQGRRHSWGWPPSLRKPAERLPKPWRESFGRGGCSVSLPNNPPWGGKWCSRFTPC